MLGVIIFIFVMFCKKIAKIYKNNSQTATWNVRWFTIATNKPPVELTITPNTLKKSNMNFDRNKLYTKVLYQVFEHEANFKW
jgi:hypothetical protein